MESKIKRDGNELCITIVENDDILSITFKRKRDESYGIYAMCYYTNYQVNDSGEKYYEMFDIIRWSKPVMRWSIHTPPTGRLASVKWVDDVLTYGARICKRRFAVHGNLMDTCKLDEFGNMVDLFTETMYTMNPTIVEQLNELCNTYISKNIYAEELQIVIDAFEAHKPPSGLFRLKFID